MVSQLYTRLGGCLLPTPFLSNRGSLKDVSHEIFCFDKKSKHVVSTSVAVEKPNVTSGKNSDKNRYCCISNLDIASEIW